MKKVFLITCLSMFVFPVYSQITHDEAKLIQDAWGLDKKAMFMEYMELGSEEGSEFWSIYDAYMEERKDLGMKRALILQDYAENYESLTPEKADDLTLRLFDNNMAMEKLQLKCYKKMKKAVGPMEASKFIQAEKYVDAVMRAEIQSNIPFIGELERMRNQ